MNIFSLAPSAALQTFHYADIDQFRQAFNTVQVAYTPTIPSLRNISAEQAILRLPGCDIYLLKTFPRIIDAQLAHGCTMVGFTMDDDFPIRINGWEKDRPSIAMGHGGSGYKIVESTASRLISMVFQPEIRTRAWPHVGTEHAVFAVTIRSLQVLRRTVLDVVRFASESSDDLTLPGIVDGLKESILAAIDDAFADHDLPQPNRVGTSTRYFDIVRKIETSLSENLQDPIYSDELARGMGISIRTIHNAMLQYRGMSLHRYLRLKRLWLVHLQLMAGGQSVKMCAAANGFWHLGEFSTIYRAHFGESPSHTLARAR